jgi:hypothetical protein
VIAAGHATGDLLTGHIALFDRKEQRYAGYILLA